MDGLTIRPAAPSDQRRLRAGVVELHERERRPPPTGGSRRGTAEHLSGAGCWPSARQGGAVLDAKAGGAFAGFAARWIAQENLIEETPDSNRYGYISDICVLPQISGVGASPRRCSTRWRRASAAAASRASG